jgi:hypothetical protein
MKTFRSILFAVLGLVFLAGTPVRGAEAAKAGAPKIIAVKFHADWCGAYPAMGPVFTDLSNKLDGRPLKENPGTGFILLFDEQRRVKWKLTARQSLKEMAAAICTECE